MVDARIREDVLNASRSFRLGMDAQGSDALTRVVDGLLGGAVGEDVLRSAARVFGELLQAQERGDMIGLADRLEFELLPLLLENPPTRR